MATSDPLRYTRIPLTHGSGAMPALGFGTLIPDPLATTEATKTALEVGFRHFDCAERYRNEHAVGNAMKELFASGKIKREDVFVAQIAGELGDNRDRLACSQIAGPGCAGLGDPARHGPPHDIDQAPPNPGEL